MACALLLLPNMATPMLQDLGLLVSWKDLGVLLERPIRKKMSGREGRNLSNQDVELVSF